MCKECDRALDIDVLDDGEKGVTVAPDTVFRAAVVNVYDEAQEVLMKKHQDYGPTNISRSPGGPLNGLRVRMWDKLARINNLIDSGAEPENESLRDSFLDLMNYAAIAQVVLDGNWPDDQPRLKKFSYENITVPRSMIEESEAADVW
jgi:hypothetical protein